MNSTRMATAELVKPDHAMADGLPVWAAFANGRHTGAGLDLGGGALRRRRAGVDETITPPNRNRIKQLTSYN